MTEDQPLNVLVVIADDMRLDHLHHMANVRTLIQDQGRTFTGSRCNVPLCQPNRVGLMTGQLSQHHGELTIGIGMPTWDDHDNAMAAWMAEAGYRCGLFGKYVNFWDSQWLKGIDAPKGWDTWRQLTGQRSAEDWDVHTERSSETITGTYQTEYQTEQAKAFVQGSEPWFCYLSADQPHAPFAPHPLDQHAWSNARCRIVPVNTEQAKAKPPWVRDVFPLNAAERAQIQQGFRGRLRELNAVDRMVAEVMAHLEAAGTLDRTVVIFTSDNGVHEGEQRRRGDATKSGPYDPALRVPMVVRGPGFAPGPTVTAPIYPMQDLTATVLDIAGATAGLPDQAGVSLRTIAADPSAYRDRTLLHEIGPEGFPSTGDGVTTGPDDPNGYHKLFRYPSRRSGIGAPYLYEMYDLAADPDELENLADVAGARARRDQLEAELDRLLDA